MARARLARPMRLGLQVKMILALGAVVIGVTLAEGWLYFAMTRTWLRKADLDKAQHLATALGVAAEADLRAGRSLALGRLVNERVGKDGVLYVAILDKGGHVLAGAGDESQAQSWPDEAKPRPSLSCALRTDDDRLLLAHPVTSQDALFWSDRLAGGVRMVVDTSGTTVRLGQVQGRIWTVAGAIILGAIPLGYLMVWRLMVGPVRRLAAVTRRLAAGDFSARCRLANNDEIGDLARAFDGMADEVVHMRDELIQANEQLEQNVADRTAELQVANHRLREEVAEKEDFLRAVSHDLNAPLRNIGGMASMILLKYRGDLPEEAVARLQRIQCNVEAETSLIGELLDLSRIRSRPQKRRPVEMGLLLADLARTFEFELKSRNIELTIADGLPRLFVEPSRIRQAFQNLIDNAIKYMDKAEGGRIDIGYERTGDEHRFRVADNGPGIPADQQERIFYVFRRAETPATTRVPGKGIGLALVRTIASSYNGRAWVQSRQGQGATFYLSLHVQDTQPPGPNDSSEAAAESPAPEAAVESQR